MVPHVKRALYISTLILVLLGGASALGADAFQQPIGQSAQHGKRRHRAHLGHHRAHHFRHKPGAVIHRSRFRSTADATAVLLGDTVVEWQYDFLPAGQAEAFQLTAPRSGLAGAVHVYISSGSAAGTLIAGLYSADSRRPGTLLSTGSTPAPRAGTWATVSLAPAQLVAGRRYWLAILGEGGKLRYRDRSRGPCPSVTSADRKLDALPASWSTAKAYSDCPVSAYVTAVPPPAPSAGVGVGVGVGLAGALAHTSSLMEEPPASLAAPLAIAPPAISGSAVEGQLLTASSGSWTGSPSSYAYQWEDCNGSGKNCSDIPGATGASYQLSAGDVGHTIRVLVKASNAGGSNEASSKPTSAVTAVTAPPPAPTSSSPPVVSGTAEAGQKLRSTTGTWSGSQIGFSYQWQQCEASGKKGCANISGAASSSYLLASRDVGHTVRVVVTATNAGGSTPADSAVTGTVAGPPPGPQIYVSQGGSGNQSGEGGCSNAHSLSWLSSGGNWGSGTGEVAPGTTVELCGTFTEPVETKGNGSPGQPITIAFMTDAKLAEPSCPGSGCLNVANNSEYITVDGGTNGVIENTNRGTHKQKSEAATVGIYAEGCKHCSFENLEVADLYVAEQGDATSNTEIRGIVVTGGEIEDIAINNDVLHDIGWAIVVSLSGKSSHVDVENDVLYHDSHGVAMTAGSSGSSLGPAIVAHDHFYADGVWSAAPGTNHMDALHCYSGGAGVHWSGGLFVYDNTFTMEGEYGVTADAYVEGTTGPECGNSTSNFWEFNNVMTGKGAGPLFALNNGLLSPYSGEDHIFNNTLIGNKTSEGVCLPLGGVPSSTSANVRYENNIATTCQTLINVERAKLASGGLDYNLYANAGTANEAFVCDGAGYYSSEFSAYKSCTGQESHSIATSDAKLNMTETAGVLGKPEAGSEAIGHGVNLTSLCGQTPEEALCENINGEPRPATGAWNIGAY